MILFTWYHGRDFYLGRCTTGGIFLAMGGTFYLRTNTTGGMEFITLSTSLVVWKFRAPIFKWKPYHSSLNSIVHHNKPWTLMCLRQQAPNERQWSFKTFHKRMQTPCFLLGIFSHFLLLVYAVGNVKKINYSAWWAMHLPAFKKTWYGQQSCFGSFSSPRFRIATRNCKGLRIHWIIPKRQEYLHRLFL